LKMTPSLLLGWSELTTAGLFAWGGPLSGRSLMTPNPWTKHYPSEVSPELDKVPYANLPELIKAAVATYSKTKAFTQVMPNGMNGSLTYAQIDTLSDNFASYLREVVGLKQGDRVAVQMPNCLAYPIVAF